jgi:hypothetical protein
MADPVEVCEAVIERLRAVLPDWHLLLSELSPMPVPGVVVELAPTKGADYVQADSDMAKWFVNITLFASAVDQEASLRKMAPLAGTKGPVIAALRDRLGDYTDSLADLSNGSVQAIQLTGFKIVRRNRHRYRAATITVTVGTN